MNTRSLQSFDGQLWKLNQHLQLTDLALTKANNIANMEVGNSRRIGKVLGGSLKVYRQLDIPNEKSDIRRTFITSRNKLHEQAIVELYRLFSNYIVSIITEIEHNNPRQFLSALDDKERSVKYEDIIAIGNYDALIDNMAKRVYRSLEKRKDTKFLLERIISTTNINIDSDLLDTALLYLQIRHLIIHNNAKADDKFRSMPKCDIVTIKKKNQKISMNIGITISAIRTLSKLCKSIDDELVSKGMVVGCYTRGAEALD